VLKPILSGEGRKGRKLPFCAGDEGGEAAHFGREEAEPLWLMRGNREKGSSSARDLKFSEKRGESRRPFSNWREGEVLIRQKRGGGGVPFLASRPGGKEKDGFDDGRRRHTRSCFICGRRGKKEGKISQYKSFQLKRSAIFS